LYLANLQALPIFLDELINAWGAVLISVTLILMFGEVYFLTWFYWIRSILLNGIIRDGANDDLFPF
jgi:hypothetical protein